MVLQSKPSRITVQIKGKVGIINGLVSGQGIELYYSLQHVV